MRLYNQLLNEFKREQTGYSTIAIIGQSCIGSVAAMVVLMNHIPEVIKLTLLFLVTILCMAYNAAVLARLSTKTTFNLLVLSVIFSILTIIGILI
ncbi:hypothetical protein V5097_10995 [Arenibacter palladensis]|uniref:hypothetical protein n=1 Tax=Arenibacter palladensis TaxID=237373 RepID=UPI002FD236C4